MYFEKNADEPVSLPHIQASTLKSVSQFLWLLFQLNTISEWDRKFVQQFTVHDGALFDIIAAANYLGIKSLLRTVCKTVIYMIRSKSSEEIREIFKVSDSFNEIANESTTNDNVVTTQANSKNQ
ncbi:unnamed protein product [Rotaria sordida]|uniref:SKP1 component dimerisation domain-containing protein n=1 Tax=Rotaria sordida TaxID=392033 RepID=A0A815ASP3_9BILA|nr:unnamed protein product [Rotaria sordida]